MKRSFRIAKDEILQELDKLKEEDKKRQYKFSFNKKYPCITMKWLEQNADLGTKEFVLALFSALANVKDSSLNDEDASGFTRARFILGK